MRRSQPPSTSLREFRAVFWPIVRLGVFLVLVTIVAVAYVAHTLTPEFTWPAAFALAAIVAPPDPVAATAVIRSLGAPAMIEIILEGEGLVSDEPALPDERTVRQMEQEAKSYRQLRSAMIAAEMRALNTLRERDIIGDEVLRRIQRDLDFETMLLEASADDVPESPYEGV